jgi:integrase
MASVRARELPENVRERSGNYYFRCRINGRQKDIPLGRDLVVAKRLAKQHAGNLAAIKGKLAHPDEATWLTSEHRHIRDHAEEWCRSLQKRGSSEVHARQCRDRVLRLLDLAGIQRISSLSAHAVEVALADLRRCDIKGRSGNERLSDRSIYHHGRAIKGFSRWLRKTKRCQDDKLIDLCLPKVLVERKRKALPLGEVAALVETTRTEPRRAGIDGPDRAVLYATAAGTGFRLGELESLTRESFNLEATPPMIRCESAYTKNGKAAVQPIRPELAEMLRSWLAYKATGRPVFVMRRRQIARVLRKDLGAAGVENAADFDFHSLRHSYITAVVKSGCSVKVAQELARHADPKLTLNVYSHLTVHDLAAGLDGLSHGVPEVGRARMRKTGTNDENMPDQGNSELAENDGEGMILGSIASQTGVGMTTAHDALNGGMWNHINTDQSHTGPTPIVSLGLTGASDEPVVSSPGVTGPVPNGPVDRSIRPTRAASPTLARTKAFAPKNSRWYNTSDDDKRMHGTLANHTALAAGS